jgi:hypothetical protein
MPGGRPRSANIPSEDRHCDKEQRVTEHRQWRRGLDSEGHERLVWICAGCHNEANKASATRRRNEGSSS